MPLPTPLPRKASKAKKKKVVAETMHDLKHGPHHKDRTHKQEVAISLKQAGLSKSKKGKAKSAPKMAIKKNDGNRRPRNKGRS